MDSLNVGFGGSWLGTQGLSSLSCGNSFAKKEKLPGGKAADATALSKGTKDM